MLYKEVESPLILNKDYVFITNFEILEIESMTQLKLYRCYGSNSCKMHWTFNTILMKYLDEYYYVATIPIYNSSSIRNIFPDVFSRHTKDVKYYRCDQIEGLVNCINMIAKSKTKLKLYRYHNRNISKRKLKRIK